MEIAILILLAVAVALLIVILLRQGKKADYTGLTGELREIGSKNTADIQQAVLTTVSAMGQNNVNSLNVLGDNLRDSVQTMRRELSDQQKSHADTLEYINRHINTRQEAMQQTMEQQLQTMQKSTQQQLAAMQQGTEQRLKDMADRLERMETYTQQSMRDMRQENAQKLEEIRGTVDEKLQTTLQKRISDSFQTVSTQLEQVYKGIGEMQRLATDVGSLKQVLSGVKTRGILGEIQLKAILEDILSPEQYEENVATIPGSTERVEFAVRLPGGDEGTVYLPIDSKFPGDTYSHLQDAVAAGDPAAVAEARRALTAVLKKSAKDIRDKYVEPPYTTTFGIMFLPFEGLYAEVVNMGMIEVLRRDYNVNVAGPSTMAALLSSLQMGFRTLAIQKRSNEVWQVLGAVKTEFGKFEDTMVKMQGHLQQTSADLENLMGTRSRAISRKLRQVQELDETDTKKLLSGEEL
ncbi:MAG: DNA recombination protein RmuC [Faecousia sp.]